MISNSINSKNQLKSFFNNELISLNLPDLIHIDTNTLNKTYLNGLYINNSEIQEINFENLEQSPFILLGDNIKSINLNGLKRIEPKSNQISNDALFYSLRYRFLSNTKLKELILPNFEGVTNMQNEADYGSPSSSNINASFTDNYWLREVTLGNNEIATTNTHLNGYWFANCYSLKYLKILYPFVIPLASNVGFQTNPIGAGNGRIYVPDNLVDAYKAATYWSTYNEKIFSLSQYELDKAEENEITDSWPQIIENCNNGLAAGMYQVGDYKTLEINGCPTQMVIVNTANAGNGTSSNRDVLASNPSQPVQLTWMEKTISRFNKNSITSVSPYSYNNSESFQTILENIFNGISDDTGLKSNNGIKLVQKSCFGFESGSASSTSSLNNFKIWVPSAAEVGFRQSQTNLVYDYFKNSSGIIQTPNYRLGETNLYTDNDSVRVNIALRDFDNNNNSRPAVVQSGPDSSTLNTNPDTASYIIFGFCT